MAFMPASALANYFEYEDITEKLDGPEIDITDKHTAAKMMAKLDSIQMRIADLQEYKREKIRILDEKIQDLEKEAQAIRKGLEAFIVNYNNGESISYPDVGTAYVSSRVELDIEDEDAVIDYLKKENRQDLIRVKEMVIKKDFKAFAQEKLENTGQLLPGVAQVEKQTFVYRSPR